MVILKFEKGESAFSFSTWGLIYSYSRILVWLEKNNTVGPYSFNNDH